MILIYKKPRSFLRGRNAGTPLHFVGLSSRHNSHGPSQTVANRFAYALAPAMLTAPIHFGVIACGANEISFSHSPYYTPYTYPFINL